MTSFTPAGVHEFIESTPTLTAMTIYVDNWFIPFAVTELVELRSLLESRGGPGFIAVEEGESCSQFWL